jgi:hypothetical protein
VKTRWERYCEMRELDNWCLRKKNLLTAALFGFFLVCAAALILGLFQ